MATSADAYGTFLDVGDARLGYLGRCDRQHDTLPGIRTTGREGFEMELPAEVIHDVRNRLHRVSGQLAGIERMLDDGRECKDVVTQISAATKALEQAGFKLVSAGLAYCLANPEEAAASGYPVEVVEKMFMKLA